MRKIALLASYSGSIFETLDKHKKEIGSVELIITNNSDANVINKAKAYNIPYDVVNTKRYENVDAQIISLIQNYKCDIIVCAGYMKQISSNLANKYTIINSHPSLLPNYGGKGMYGSNVHKAVVAAKEEKSGVTIHYVNENYDEGAIILQKELELSPDESAKSLEIKIKELEKIAYIEALKLV
jgi:phosphoribosylglycinamide formyltransferase-1